MILSRTRQQACSKSNIKYCTILILFPSKQAKPMFLLAIAVYSARIHILIRFSFHANLLLPFPDSPTSTVQGILTKDGLFDGHISTSDEDFYIEPASRYFPPNIEEDPPKSRPFHSVIYKASDVIHPLDANSEVRILSKTINNSSLPGHTV